MPKRWKIEYLDELDNWQTLKNFDGSQIPFGADGYLELQYGLTSLSQYTNIVICPQISSTDFLPSAAPDGYAYLVVENTGDIGTHFVKNNANILGGEYNGTLFPGWDVVPVVYGWDVATESLESKTPLVTNLTSPDTYKDGTTTMYREFQHIRGLRIVVTSMNKADTHFDLIELSPRLAADISYMTKEYSVSRIGADVGSSPFPIGSLSGSEGSLTLFDYDMAFSEANANSVLNVVKDNEIQYNISTKNFQVKFYEVIENIEGYDYFIPIKTLYAEGLPETSATDRTTVVKLSDLFRHFSSIKSPEMLVPNASVSYIVATLLDSIGFTNYKFYRAAGESEDVIPFFFTPASVTIADTLTNIAKASQTAMFFDETNNLIIASRGYMFPSSGRDSVFTFKGTADQVQSGVYSNQRLSGSLSNIIEISSHEQKVFNDGKVTYSPKYIQKSVKSIQQATSLDKERQWNYKAVPLWEVSEKNVLRSINGERGNPQGYALTAIPLNDTLSKSLPEVVEVGGVKKVINNVMSFSDSVYWMGRYKGYFYANGEVIRYDAIEHHVTGIGDVWISSVDEYEDYFSKVPFNGKIFPTGKVRIYAEVSYDASNNLKTGVCKKHGRGQFGTPVVDHPAGVADWWTNAQSTRGCEMRLKYLIDDSSLPVGTYTAAGLTPSALEYAGKSSISGQMHNFLASDVLSESTSSKPDTVSRMSQASALTINGPAFKSSDNPVNFIIQKYKALDSAYRHFGTRLRIVGQTVDAKTKLQTPVGAAGWTTIDGSTVSGASGGMSVLYNPTTNTGYYFEIVALTDNNVINYSGEKAPVNNIFFYKLRSGSDSTHPAVPELLWSGLSSIFVDSGRYSGAGRVMAEEFPTVFDLAVEYEDLDNNNRRQFYLYINQVLIATVIDDRPTPAYNCMSLFVRGSSRVMFENVYALSSNYGTNVNAAVTVPLNSVFASKPMTSSQALKQYALSGAVQQTYLSGIGTGSQPQYSMFYDEFGTIMREAAYFNIKFEDTYPALKSMIAPTFNTMRGYTVSGYSSSPYGAEFLIFNNTDTVLALDEDSGNFLKILGVAFTQQADQDVTVDEYFADRSSMSNVDEISSTNLSKNKIMFQDIKNSRTTYGKNEFAISSPYIQSKDMADRIMEWTVARSVKPRKSLGLKVFPNPLIQIGDIVSVDYKDKTGMDVFKTSSSKFVVCSIEFTKSADGPEMTVGLSEVY